MTADPRGLSGLSPPQGALVPVVLLGFALVGVLQSLCFGHDPSAWIGWLAWAPLVWLTLQRRWSRRLRWSCAFLCGVIFWCTNIPWIAHTISVHGGLPRWSGWLLLVVLASYMALYWWAFVAVGSWLIWRRRTDRPEPFRVAATLAGLWVLLESVRERLFTGFPWTPLGEAALNTPGGLDASSWVGVRGLSFVILFTGAVIACSLPERWGGLRPPGGREPLLAATLLGVMAALWGAGCQGDRWQQAITSADGSQPMPVRVVQPNIPIQTDGAQFTRNFQRLLRLSRCSDDTLVIWPESAAFPYTWERHATLRREVREIVGGGCSLLLNTSLEVELEEGGTGWVNAGLLVEPGPRGSSSDLELQRYDKLHLVPYGEYVPLRSVLPFVSQLARAVGEFRPGDELELLRWRDAVLGLSICFEVVFPAEVAQRARRGATVLVTLTNDAWFGPYAAPEQHLRSARFRAAENRRPLLFAAITGVSAVVDARGRVLQRLPMETAGVLEAELGSELLHVSHDRGPPAPTLFTRAPWGAEALGALCLLSAFLPRRQRPEDGP